jgi:H+/Cl- antiporter ClcA
MTPELLKTLGQIAGIGGIALGAFLILYRDIIRKKIFSQLTKQQGFQLLILITVLVWSIALAGIGAWVWSNGRSENAKGDNIKQQIESGATGVIHTGDGDVNIDKPVAP